MISLYISSVILTNSLFGSLNLHSDRTSSNKCSARFSACWSLMASWPLGAAAACCSADDVTMARGKALRFIVKMAVKICVWLVVWNHGILWLSIQLGMSSSQLTFIFFRGVGIPPTRCCFFLSRHLEEFQHFNISTWFSNQKVMLSPLRNQFFYGALLWNSWEMLGGVPVVWWLEWRVWYGMVRYGMVRYGIYIYI